MMIDTSREFGGNGSARIRVRVKRWLYKDWGKIFPMMPAPAPISVSKCARCGMIWNGPMGYCCPEGNMCGVPRDRPVTQWHGVVGISTAVTPDRGFAGLKP